MGHVLCTFNANNLFLRYKFAKTFFGDRSGKSRLSKAEAEVFGYLPANLPGSFEVFAPEMRDLAARALRRDGTKDDYPDIVCVQEVESLLALRRFNQEHLSNAYPYALVIDSHDLRQIDVGILSKHELTDIRTHVDDHSSVGTKKDPWLFSRDCLEVDVVFNKSGTKRITLFINHLKSKMGDTDEERKKAAERRELQAEAVRAIVRRRFPGAEFTKAHFAVVGDLNDEPGSDPVAPLVKNCGLVNALERISQPEDRWTYWYKSKNRASQIDYLLLSPALDKAAQKKPEIERRGIAFRSRLANGQPGPKQTYYCRKDGDPNPIPVAFQFPRFAKVGPNLAASDHCPVFLDVP